MTTEARGYVTVADSSMSESASSPFQGQVALVTGAAKRLGRAVALSLAEQGADLVVHYGSSKDEAQEVVAEVEKLGRRAAAVHADLTSVSDIRQLFDETSKRFGRLDILINSAANFVRTEFEHTTEEIWDSVLDTNLKAPFFCAQAAAPLLRSNRGVIINFGDIAGILSWTGYMPHCVSKAGIIMLTRLLAKELAPEVRVNAIAPGTISMPGDAPETKADYIKQSPLRNTGTPHDVTSAVAFLVRAPFVTGQVLVVDGGRTL
jgi:NAD(P)-dependent dehydrogenase (short-subunit alcohol dehydrogenase family)